MERSEHNNLFREGFGRHERMTKRTCGEKLDSKWNKPITHSIIVTVVLLDLLVLTALLLIDQNIIQNPRQSSGIANRTSSSSQHTVKDVEIQRAEYILHVIQIVIISCFLLEIMLRIIARGSGIRKDAYQLYDILVVIVNFTVYVVLAATLSDTNRTVYYAAGFLVVLRLWRIIRIRKAIVTPFKDEVSRLSRFYSEALKSAEEKEKKAKSTLADKERENERLKEQIIVLERNATHVGRTAAHIGRCSTMPNVQNHGEDIVDSSLKSSAALNKSDSNCLYVTNLGDTQATTKIPDIVENTPEHSIGSSADYKDDLDSQNIQLTVGNQNRGATDISIQMENFTNNEENAYPDTKSSLYSSKLIPEMNGKADQAYLNFGFDSNQSAEEMAEIKRISQIPFSPSVAAKDQGDIPLTDL